MMREVSLPMEAREEPDFADDAAISPQGEYWGEMAGAPPWYMVRGEIPEEIPVPDGDCHGAWVPHLCPDGRASHFQEHCDGPVCHYCRSHWAEGEAESIRDKLPDAPWCVIELRPETPVQATKAAVDALRVEAAEAIKGASGLGLYFPAWVVAASEEEPGVWNPRVFAAVPHGQEIEDLQGWELRRLDEDKEEENPLFRRHDELVEALTGTIRFPRDHSVRWYGPRTKRPPEEVEWREEPREPEPAKPTAGAQEVRESPKEREYYQDPKMYRHITEVERDRHGRLLCPHCGKPVIPLGLAPYYRWDETRGLWLPKEGSGGT